MNLPLPLLSDDDPGSRRPARDDGGFGALDTARGPLPLKAMDVRVRIDGLLALVSIAQTFVNTHAEAIEATYIFPLPDRAAVRSFRLEVAGRVIAGVLEEREKARAAYDQAVREGRRAAIAEEDRPNVYSLRVGNLMPGDEAVVRLELTGPLSVDSGEATFRFPLVVAPRYISGVPLPGPSVGGGVEADTDAVPDGSRLSPPVLLPGFPNPVRFALSVELCSAGLVLSDCRSSLHTVVVEEEDGVKRLTVMPGERLDRDFILRFRVGDEAVGTSLVAVADDDGGTFALTLVPPVGSGASMKPRDVVFVLDRSGSMQGWKMVAARRALGRMIDTLGALDRFTVLAFDGAVETPPGHGDAVLVAANDHARFGAIAWLSRLEARGGTELLQPLERASAALADGARDRVLVLVTDGQVGNEDQILRALAPRLKGLRIFALGIDRAVNDAFLRRLATLGGGVFELVESEDRLDEVMTRVHRRIAAPVLRDVRLKSQGIAVDHDSLVPRRLPDLFPGAPLVVAGRFHGRAGGKITVTASDEAGLPWSRTIAATVAANPAIAAVWARAQVRELEDRFVIGDGDLAKLEKAIVATSLRFSVLSRFTAYVAIDSDVANLGGQVHRIVQPVELAAGWTTPGAGFGASGASPGVMACSAPMAMARAISHTVEAASLAPEPVDLAAYRARAGEMLAALKTGDTAPAAERVRALAVVAVKLAELVEDLRSIAVDKAEWKPLADIVSELRRFIAGGSGEAAALGKAWRETSEALAAFSADKPRAARLKPWSFWK